MATPGIPFVRWADDHSYLLVGPGVESTSFKLDDPETDLTATSVLALQAGTGRFVVTSVTGGTGDVQGPGLSVDNALARFDGASGKVIQSSPVVLDDAGGLTGVTTINGGAIPPGGAFGNVVGPGSATNNAIASYNGTSGKLIKDNSVTVSGGALAGVTTVNGLAPGNVVGPGSATDTAIAAYNGTTGKLIQNSAVTVSGGALAGVTTINGLAPGNVVGPGSATDTALARYNGTTGRIIQDSAATLDGAGQLTLSGVAFANGVGLDAGPWLNNWQRTSVPATFSGPWAANQAGGLILERIGNVVHVMEFLVMTSAANGAPALIALVGTLPAAYRPLSGNKNGPITVQTGGGAAQGQWDVSPAGALTIGLGLSGANFPADGLSAGIVYIQTLVYLIS